MNFNNNNLFKNQSATSNSIQTQNFRAYLNDQQNISIQDINDYENSSNAQRFSPISSEENLNMSVESIQNPTEPITYIYTQPLSRTNSTTPTTPENLICSAEVSDNTQSTNTFNILCNEILFDQDLYSTLMEINPENIDLLYKLCINKNIASNQVKYLKDFHIRKLIPEDQLGVMAEFECKLEMWKISKNTTKDDTEICSSRKSKNTSKKLLDIIAVNKNLMSKINKPSLTLTETEIRALVRMIVDHFINEYNEFHVSDMESLSLEIAKYFPNEASETYFQRYLDLQKDGSMKSKVKGKLVSRWTNSRASKETTTKVQSLVNSIKETQTIVINEIVNESQQKSIQASLKGQSNLPFEMVMRDWNNSRDLRLKNIIENKSNSSIILKDWPAYSWPEGNILVTICFIYLYI